MPRSSGISRRSARRMDAPELDVAMSEPTPAIRRARWSRCMPSEPRGRDGALDRRLVLFLRVMAAAVDGQGPVSLGAWSAA